MKFCNCIKTYRNRNQLTRRELANMLGVSVAAVYSWEKGKHMPHHYKIRKYSRKLDVNLAWLLGVDDRMERRKRNSSVVIVEGDKKINLPCHRKAIKQAFDLFKQNEMSGDMFMTYVEMVA